MVSPNRVGNVLSWASDLDPKAMEQAQRTAELPFVHGHVALMPDAHVGMGATIGSVIPTRGAVVPAAVGVDIGCGMVAVQTQFSASDLPDDLSDLHSRIESVVPAGVGQGHPTADARAADLLADDRVDLTDKQTRTAGQQMGSLGGGNHFVEVCLDEQDRCWVMLHSGSRGIGNQLAQTHIKAAKGQMKQQSIELDDPNLAHLVEGTPQFDEYISAMRWAQDYAAANRDVMVDAVIEQLGEFVGRPVETIQRINCHHNFCELEHHGGEELWVTRKGAIRARPGELGVIPGSMGAQSYIVEGLGSPESYHSSSHGAGRQMSRRQARRQLDVDGFRKLMAGKAWNKADAKKLLDEDPRSYKDIDQVMEDQRDLVKVLHTLRQIVNFKGL